jgi:prevent-host-death family protein
MDKTATLSELHIETKKVMHPVIHDGDSITITEHGKPCAKIVPVENSEDRKALCDLLRSMGPIDLPPRK